MRLRRYAKKRGVEISGSWSRIVGNLNDSVLDEAAAFCVALNGGNMCVNPSGDIYGCSYSTTKLGTLAEFGSYCNPEGRYHNFVSNHLAGVTEKCKGCMIECQCGGGCQITREFSCAQKTPKVEQMCSLYRRMTTELLLDQLRDQF